MKKYLVLGGNVRSRTDGQIHFISADKLINLYGLNRSECILADERRLETYKGIKGLKIKTPRERGDYE